MARSRSIVDVDLEAGSTPESEPTKRPRGRGRQQGPTESAAASTVAATPARRRPSRPLSQGELVKALVKRVGNERPARSSVRLSRGPRGQVMPEVLVHVGDDPRIKTVEEAAAYAQSIFDLLCVAYPMFEAGGGNGGES